MTILRKNRLTINAIDDDEKSFHRNLTDAFGKKWHKHSAVYPNAIGIHNKGGPAYFYKKKYPKKRIVIHATHGYLSGDVGNLSKQRVSTSYLIARDGTVYEMFDPSYWSYHIGSVGKNYWCTNTEESKHTIAIELSNMGDLRPHHRKPEILIDAWGYPYCMTEDYDFYSKQLYRGHEYFATYTIEQYRALDSLLLFLCREFDILHHFVDKEDRFELLTEEPRAGIVTHVNYRKDKLDVNPSFNWSLVSGR